VVEHSRDAAADDSARVVTEFCHRFSGAPTEQLLSRLRHRVEASGVLPRVVDLAGPLDARRIGKMLALAYRRDPEVLMHALEELRTENARLVRVHALLSGILSNGIDAPLRARWIAFVEQIPVESRWSYWLEAARLELPDELRPLWRRDRGRLPNRIVELADASWGDKFASVAVCDELRRKTSLISASEQVRDMLAFPRAFRGCYELLSDLSLRSDVVEATPDVVLRGVSMEWAARIAWVRVARAAGRRWARISEVESDLAVRFKPCAAPGVCVVPEGRSAKLGLVGGDDGSSWLVVEMLGSVGNFDLDLASATARALRAGGYDMANELRFALGGPESAMWRSLRQLILSNSVTGSDRRELLRLLVQASDASGADRATLHLRTEGGALSDSNGELSIEVAATESPLPSL